MSTKRWITGGLVALTLAMVGCGANPVARTVTATDCWTDSDSGTLHARDASTPDVPIRNFTKVTDTLYRGGYPTSDNLAQLAKLGVKTDICLMNGLLGSETELVAQEKANCSKAGIRWVNVPLPFGQQPPMTMVNQVLATIAAGDNQPVYIHCKVGRDRTGTMIAAYRIQHDHWSGDQALQEMESFGFDPKKYPFFAQFVLDFGARNSLDQPLMR